MLKNDQPVPRRTLRHADIEPPMYYWRDSQWYEVYLLIENVKKLFPVEIRSG